MRTLLAILYVLVFARFVRPPMCRDYLGWHAYDNGLHDFGYMDWFCQRARGHSGDHWGTSLDLPGRLE